MWCILIQLISYRTPSCSYSENVDGTGQEALADDVTVIFSLILERKRLGSATRSYEDDGDGGVGVSTFVLARVRPHHPLAT